MSEQVDNWVASRRAALGDASVPAGHGDIWGLALSGGGIRSATFCFGLVRALSKGGALPRFDVVSTVSGGGYIGSALGKLFHHARDAGEVRQVHAALQSADYNWFTWWLRANGRYLIPRGFKDSIFALALYLQNLVGLHVELGVLALLLGMLLAFVNIVAWAGLAALPDVQSTLLLLPYAFRWLPTLWLLLLPMALAAIVLLSSYWTLPEPGTEGSRRPSVYMFAAATALVALMLVRPPLDNFDRTSGLWIFAVLIAAGWGLAFPTSRRALAKARERFVSPTGPGAAADARSEALARDEARHLLTQKLSALGRAATAVLAAGALDRLAWYLAFEVEALQWLAGALLVVTVLLRTVLPKLVPTSATATPTLGIGLAALGNIVGYLMLAGVVLSWLTAFDKLLFAESANNAMFTWSALGVSVVVMLALCAYAWISRYNFGFLNLSSLHNFYRARITRGFLGAANGLRFPMDGAAHPNLALHAIDPVPDEPAGGRSTLVEVTNVDASDDIAMAQYQPQRCGGPVHFINVCINETSDRRGGLFNQDRRGLPMVIGPAASVRVGSQPWQAAHGDGALTLGRWAAISGAAFAPGLGQMTRGGVSALATLSGLRLGYWWHSHTLDGADAPAPGRASKSRGLVNELLGTFQAGTGQPWYLSDGGHYENTGALTLLAEGAGLIVLADCGADPRYGFTDLENLVRKARIDLQAEIEFLRPLAAQPDDRLDDFGSLDDLASPQSVACLALARVAYGRTGRTGYLVLVKPNLSLGMTADLENFKRDNPDFPQETTTDQFFGEAQWESYFKLGRILGRNLTRDLLDNVVRIAPARFEVDRGASSQRMTQAQGDDGAGKPAPRAAGGVRLPARIAGSAVAASVGLGAAATIGVSAWQALDGLRMSYVATRVAEEGSLKELADRYGAWMEGKPESLGPLAASLLRAADGPCSDGNNAWFRSSLLAQCILKDVRFACEAAPADKLPACRMFNVSNAANCLAPRLSQRSHYWGFEFDDPKRPKTESCPEPRHVNPPPLALPVPVPLPPPLPLPVPVPVPMPVPVPVPLPVPLPPPVIPQPEHPPIAATPPASAGQGAPMPVPLPRPAPAPIASTRPCTGKTVYVQVFGGAQREALRNYREQWRQLGASVPPFEDVLDTANRAGRTPPRPDGANTYTYFHDEASQACAQEVVEQARILDSRPAQWAQPTKLPGRLRATPGTIEVWVAPPAAKSEAARAAAR